MEEITQVVHPKISNLIPEQFPAVYQDQGPVFVAFIKAYYEWMEETDNTLDKSRNLQNYRNIDTTPESFLVHFQKKYLYGIPFDVIINKRLLLKHIFDVYRSKSSFQCFKLLFRLIYNEDMELYLPGKDLLRASDGTWKEVRYLEVTSREVNPSYVGKKIVGLVSKTTAIVESYISEPVNQTINNALYISNITPRGGEFTIGEKIVLEEDFNSSNFSTATTAGPLIIGSLDSIEITNSGVDFEIGDVVKVVQRDLVTNDIISFGRDGLLKVTAVERGRGSLIFTIIDGAFTFRTDSLTYVYNDPGDTTGTGADFDVNSVSNSRSVEYNTDIIANYMDLAIGAVTSTFTTADDDTLKSDSILVTADSTDGDEYDFPGLPTANLSSTLGDTLEWSNGIFGSIASLTNIQGGSNYTLPASVYVKTPNYTKQLPGLPIYNTASKTVTGFDTRFDRTIIEGMVLYLEGEAGNAVTTESHVVKTVTNSTSIELYDYPLANSTGTAFYKSGPNTMTSNYVAIPGFPYDPVFSLFTDFEPDISAFPAIGTGIAASLEAIDSGKGYVTGEFVEMYLSGGVENPTIENGGTGYANGEVLIFVGGDPLTYPVGTVATDGSGTITSVGMTENGSGLTETPTITVRTVAGTGASIVTTLKEFNTVFQITGLVQKSSVGRRRGYWSTTRSFLNSDKYIQDSLFYQDFSYQIETALTLNKYSDILYDTFHIASTELFGKFKLITKSETEFDILYSNTAASLSFSIYIFADDTVIKADSTVITSDSFFQWATADRTIITADEILPTVDFVE